MGTAPRKGLPGSDERKQVSPPGRASALQDPRPCRCWGHLCEGQAGASCALCSSSASVLPCLRQPSFPFPSPPCPLLAVAVGFGRPWCQLEAARCPSRALSLSPGAGDVFWEGLGDRATVRFGFQKETALGVPGLWRASASAGREAALPSRYFGRCAFSGTTFLTQSACSGSSLQSLKLCDSGLPRGQPRCLERVRGW